MRQYLLEQFHFCLGLLSKVLSAILVSVGWLCQHYLCWSCQVNDNVLKDPMKYKSILEWGLSRGVTYALSFCVLKRNLIAVSILLLCLWFSLSLLQFQPSFVSFVAISAVLFHCIKAMLLVTIIVNRYGLLLRGLRIFNYIFEERSWKGRKTCFP